MKFRKDINGLRAIAVIAVVLFHFKPSLMSGGFAGVDVFFVISGFLMTGIIFRGVEKEDFSLLNFYIARANRIIPPLAILCFILVILGWNFLTTWDYKSIGRDVATSMFFVSNIMYSLRSGYFDSGDIFLLHTWSLSVEWQFYIVYPVIIMFLKRFFQISTIKIVLINLLIFSFIFSVFASVNWPTFSYFSLLTRAWEMMLGGVACLYPLTLNKNKIYTNGRVIELLGITLIIVSYFTASEESLWPGYLALLPVLGAFLIIQAQVKDSFITGNIILQKIGLWSYSIYLWHWPIAVSFSYYAIDESYTLVGILLSVLLGFLSFTFIEKRKFKSQSNSKPIIIYSLILLSFLTCGALLFKTQGFADRELLTSNSLIQGGTADDFIVHEGVSLLGTGGEYDYLLLGDSNSNHYTRGIINEGTPVKISWWATCMSFPNSINKRNSVYPEWKERCINNYKQGLNETAPIIIAQSWSRPEKNSLECLTEQCYLTGNYYIDLESQLQDLFSFYGESTQIYIIGELPIPEDKNIIKCLNSERLIGITRHCDSLAKPAESVAKVNEVLKRVSNKYDHIKFIDPYEALCIDNVCDYAPDNKSVFMADGGHLSGYGSELIWGYIISKVGN